jgi:biopolymer transport protein ExbD
MRRRKNKSHSQSEVELNLAAMLDMAFQLLSFFILTYQPPAAECQINVRMPLPQAIAADDKEKDTKITPGQDVNSKEPVIELPSLVINVNADTKTGLIAKMGIGKNEIKTLPQLQATLTQIFTSKGDTFKQVVIEAGDSLRYEELMRVIDICTQLKTADGKPLTSLTFVNLPDTPVPDRVSPPPPAKKE